MTLQEIFNAHKGYTERQFGEWRRARWLGAIFANAFSTKEIKPSDLLKLPGDEGDESVEDQVERLKEMRKWRTEH